MYTHVAVLVKVGTFFMHK